jgi:hypothetical protein
MVRRIGVLASFLLISAATLVASPPPLPPLTIVVRLENYAPVNKRPLSYAKRETARIFRQMGVRIEWQDQWVPVADVGAPAFSVVLLSPSMAVEKSRRDEVVGSALAISSQRTGRAYVFYERLCTAADAHGLDEGLLLSEVMNHELGHMIADLEHDSVGIMRKFLATRSSEFFTFTRAQQAAIRSALTAAMKADVPMIALRAAPDFTP